jgi:endonuclease/exonuclease/phosphatase family metal-dependent hydrolase
MSDRSLLLLDQIRDYDVVCLNEAFQFGSHIVDTFVNKSEDFGFRYVVSGATVPLLSRKVLDSGVLILSKYPILVTDAVVFEDGCSYDSFAAKGAVYAQIGVGRDRRIHIFASHLQASYRVVTEVDFGVRKSQSRDVKALVAKWAAQSRPGDPIILLGDMNIDSIGEQEEYTQLMQTLALPGYDLIDTLKSKGHPVTLAASEEGQSEPIERFLTLKEDWGYQQSIDYIFLYEPVNAPVFARYEAETRKFAVSGRVYQQLSDHIGVECFVEFA